MGPHRLLRPLPTARANPTGRRGQEADCVAGPFIVGIRTAQHQAASKKLARRPRPLNPRPDGHAWMNASTWATRGPSSSRTRNVPLTAAVDSWATKEKSSLDRGGYLIERPKRAKALM